MSSNLDIYFSVPSTDLSNSITKHKTLRQIFGSFKKSKVCYDLIPKLLQDQLYLCPITKLTLSMNSKMDISHIIPLSILETKVRPYNEDLAILLTTHYKNLFMEDSKSNRKRKDKITPEIDGLFQEVIIEFNLQNYI